MKGMIRTVKNEGWGFIKGEDGNEYFFHQSALIESDMRELVVDRTKVEFEPTQGKKGPRAESVRLIND